MGAVREFSQGLLSGAIRVEEYNPFSTFQGLEQFAPGLAFVSSMANSIALETSEGLVLFDTGSQFTAMLIHEAVREWSRAPAHSVVYTHGHIDHVMGASLWDADSMASRGKVVRVLAHEKVPARFERYVLTAGYNGAINARQFRVPGLQWPTEYRSPDALVGASATVTVGDTVSKPWLRPVYDEPEFVLRNLWRLYGGWYDGNPAHLKPAHPDAVAREVAALAGGAHALVDRAEKLASDGELRLACELAEWAGRAAPDDEGVRRKRAAIYRLRAEHETSLMAKGVYQDAANQ
jgi:alkyl sulfatase BDS1-like metallo-beta-lactamase superfamily hydrolase